MQTVKSATAREVFALVPEVKKKLWGGEFWGEGYFVNTVGQLGSEKVIAEYVKRQGQVSNYRRLHGTDGIEILKCLGACSGVLYFIF